MNEGSRPLFAMTSDAFSTWTAEHPEGFVLAFGEGSAIHRAGSACVLENRRGYAVCSPDTLALEFAMHRLGSAVVACAVCEPLLDVPVEEFPVPMSPDE